jgi:hypothetical protein
MTPHVLILSGLYDFSTDLVTLELERRDVPYLRLNREQLPTYRLSLDPLSPRLDVDCQGDVYTLGPSLSSVWFRQPVFLRNTPSTPISPQEQLERSQWMAFLRGLTVFRDARWMNHPQVTYLAESKPYQLAVAAACGFQVPHTLASNDARRIRATFPASHIVKSLDTVLLLEGDDVLFTYTTTNSGGLVDDETTATAPLLAQQLLTDKVDLRVTVIGEHLSAVRILCDGIGIPGDWRLIGREQLEYRDIELDAVTEERCFMLIRQLGLTYGAIDLLETPDGIFFIEVNPTGEWGWLSSDQRPLHQAIASWLQGFEANLRC